MRIFLPFALSLLMAPMSLLAQASNRTILVLDASGSMWGQIDGKAKITIAQEVIGELLQSLPPETELGLTAYGHRRKGDCGDIETLILPQADTNGDQRAAIASAVNAIKPKGKTPLSAAVIAAAEALKYTEERATVILISDGKETCDFDPCEVGRRLEASGVDFTAHVIGFDISDPADRAELQCLAHETGGTFRTASNAAELSAALAVVAEPEPAPTFDLTFIATEGDGGPVISQGLSWTLGTSRTGPFMAQSQPGPDIGFARIPIGTPLVVQVTRQQDGASAELTLVVDKKTPATSILVLPDLPPEPQRLRAIAREEGTNRVIDMDLNWTIMDAAGKVLIDNQLLQRPEISVLPGVYQVTVLRAEDGATASLQIEVKELARDAVLKLPALAVPAPLLMNARETGVNGVLNRELVWTLYDKDNQVVLDHVTGPTASTRVLAGRYRVDVLRTEDEHTETLEFAARRDGTTITVTFPPYAPPATLAAVDTAPAGSPVLVDWTGPGQENDYVTVVGTDAADHKFLSYEYTRTGPTVSLTMPAQPGRYELRYVLGESRRALARRVIEVTPLTASLNAPDSAAAGAGVPVDWTGPDYASDHIAVARVGAPAKSYVTYAYTKPGTPLSVRMPTDPGTYELRYVMSQGPVVLASRSITVSAVSAALSAPATGVAGETIVIDWSGPNYQSDYITVAEVGASDRKYTTYGYTKTGSPLRLALPLTPGAYELRYVIGQDSSVAARAAITITPVSASLEAPARAVAGSTISVAWEGPDYGKDFITIAETGTRDGKYLTYANTRNANPVEIQTPAHPGSYELRYLASGTPQTVLARQPLEVSDVAATLSAKASAPVGGSIAVTWDGPDYLNDIITISLKGDKRYKTYAYTRNGSPAEIKLPDAPGEYEIRYVMNQNQRVIARIDLTVQ